MDERLMAGYEDGMSQCAGSLSWLISRQSCKDTVNMWVFRAACAVRPLLLRGNLSAITLSSGIPPNRDANR